MIKKLDILNLTHEDIDLMFDTRMKLNQNEPLLRQLVELKNEVHHYNELPIYDVEEIKDIDIK